MDHRYHWIDIRVGANLGRRFMVKEPDISGEAYDRAGHDQVDEREPCAAETVCG